MMASRLPLLLVLSALAALALTGNLLTTWPPVVALQLCALALSVWARRSFRAGTFRVEAEPGASEIIEDGPYGYIRHPMYAAATLLTWTGFVGHPSVLTAGLGAAVVLVVLLRIAAEERILRESFPGYGAYARRTKALVPFVF